jgi:hypothetical protein
MPSLQYVLFALLALCLNDSKLVVGLDASKPSHFMASDADDGSASAPAELSCSCSNCTPGMLPSCFSTIANCNPADPFFCHQYTRAFIEKNWIHPFTGLVQPGAGSISSLPGAFDNDVDYIKVCSSANGEIISYGPGHHSAVRLSVSDPGCEAVFASKLLCSGPIVRHPLNIPTSVCQYSGSNVPNHFQYIGKLPPSWTIDTNSEVQFGVRQKNGVNYSWSMQPNRSWILQFVGPTNGSSVKVKRTCCTSTVNNSVQLCMTASSPCSGSSKTQCININVVCGCSNSNCSTVCFNGLYNTSSSQNNVMNTVNFVPAGAVNVSLIGCSNFYRWCPQTSGFFFTNNSNGSTASFSLSSGQSISFNIKAFSSTSNTSCSSTSFTCSRTVTFAASSWGMAPYSEDPAEQAAELDAAMMAESPQWPQTAEAPITELFLYPNPTDGQVIISRPEGWANEAFEIKNINGVTVKSGIIPPGKSEIDLSHLAPGVYLLISGNQYVRFVKRN